MSELSNFEIWEFKSKIPNLTKKFSNYKKKQDDMMCKKAIEFHFNNKVKTEVIYE